MMEIIEGKPMMLLPPAKHLCQECATKHEPEAPHNAQSLYYQTKFSMEHGRGATWLDAMAHCTEIVQKAWTAGLKGLGVDVEGGQVNPPRRR